MNNKQLAEKTGIDEKVIEDMRNEFPECFQSELIIVNDKTETKPFTTSTNHKSNN